MRNIKLELRFVGTNYHGWQVQKNGITVQEVLSSAIGKITSEDVTVIGCGRTDAGVHAENYVASFKTESNIKQENLVLAINSHLPKDIVCLSAEDVPIDFDASRSATKKRYVYSIYNSEICDPFYEPFVHQVKGRLDIAKMKKAAEYFIGEHDFVGFAAAGYTVKTTVRTIYSLDITAKGNLIELDVCGNGFLYNMVRIIAGTLIFVGYGKIEVDDIPSIIESKCRERAGITAPAKGLRLKEVYYGE